MATMIEVGDTTFLTGCIQPCATCGLACFMFFDDRSKIRAVCLEHGQQSIAKQRLNEIVLDLLAQ